MAMTVKVDNIDQAVKQLTKYADKVQEKTIDTINQTMLETRNGAVRSAPVNFGQLRASLTLTKMSKTAMVSEVYSNVDYAPFVEFGTKSKTSIPPELREYASQFIGLRTGGFDKLLADIRDWCKKKGIEESAAYPIALKIAREGVKAQPFLFPAFEKERADLIPKLERLLKDA